MRWVSTPRGGLRCWREVPGDDLALAVLVGREVDRGGRLQRGPEVLDDLLAPLA